MSKKQSIERVRWVDSCSPRGWTQKEALKGYVPVQIESIGWVVSEDANSLTLAGHASTTEYDGIMCIPKAVITSRKKL